MSRTTTVDRKLIERVWSLRAEGLTQAKIADRVGRSLSLVNAIVRGRHPACKLEAVRREYGALGHVLREERDGALVIRVPRDKAEKMKSWS